MHVALTIFQNPPLYLHVTSTSKAGLEKAIAKIEELMKQELPNLVDERRFRRREPEQVERDEFGRVSDLHNASTVTPRSPGHSANGPKNGFPLIWRTSPGSTYGPKS